MEYHTAESTETEIDTTMTASILHYKMLVLHERAVNICRALAKIQTEDVRGYKLRMMAVLSKIEAMTR